MIAIDLGSNTLRVLLYDCVEEESTFSYEKVVKTADGLVECGRVSSEAVCRVINAIQTVQMKIDFSEHKVVAVTTEALRQASNRDEILKEIFEVTGVAFDIISGDEEARMTLLAVKRRLERLVYPSSNFVLVDIGGGSTELIFNYGKKSISKSFPIGIVTIAQSYPNLNDIEKALPRKMIEMQEFCTKIYGTRGISQAFVATAGTPTTIASMKLGYHYSDYDASQVNGTVLLEDELDFYLDKLLSMSFEGREEAVGTGRSELILAGILIYKHIYKILSFKECIIIDDGLREGVALDFCDKL
jgi:exopolyphosphatase/guanosine-5'-triphosphate,3'-diphosphate pyrophosphatase